MAVNEVAKRQNIAKGLMADIVAIMNSVEDATFLVEQYSHLTAGFQDSDFLPAMPHLDANTMLVAQNALSALKTQMDSQGWTAAFEKVIP